MDKYDERRWQRCVELAEHFLAVDWTEIYLGHGEWSTDRPWEYVTHCKPGGSHRLEISTDIWFYAEHPCGLTFRWSFDLEPQEANGSSYYQIDVAGVQRVLRALPNTTRDFFRAYLHECATAVADKASEWQEIATQQQGTANRLFEAARQ